MTFQTKDRNLTEGPILKKMLSFAFPMMMGNLLQQIYNIADTIIVGRVVGSQALASVGAAYSLMTFLTSVMIGLCMGCSACMAMSYGAEKYDEMKEKIWASFWMIALVTALILGLVYGFEDRILQLLKVPKDVYLLLHDYLKIVFAGIGFTFLYNYFSFFLRAIGNSVIPLFYLGAASVLNIFLDVWFVAGNGWGVKGAAAATVFAQAFAGIGITFYVFTNMKKFLPERAHCKFRKTTVQELAEYSVLTSLQQSVMNFGILMIQGLVNTFGTEIMAAFASVVKIDTIAYMPAQEFGNAYSLYVSQNYGAERKERIRVGTRLAFMVSITFSSVISALVWLNAGNLMCIFVDPSETAIFQAGIHYLHIEGAFYAGIGALFLFYGLYRGIAKPSFSLVLTIISLGSRVLLAYTFAPRSSFGVSAIWWAIPIGWFLADFAGLCYYLLRIRKEEYIYEAEKENFVLQPIHQGIFRTLIEAIGTVYEEAEQKGVEIELKSQHDQFVLHDRAWTARALVYILKNAVKYCENGDRIEISLVNEDRNIGIQVEDTGIGILPEDLPQIFKKHYRGKNALEKEGYGIGLYLARKIIEKENGWIQCETEAGNGSCFTIWLKR